MRPPRIIIAVAFFTTTVFLTFLSLRSSHPPQTVHAASPRTGIRSFFRAPFSLFPPNAIITLTHENSTAFLARPAFFGPSLPEEGLKGQLWIGSGFGNDGAAEGELGCSDVPDPAANFGKSGAVKSNGAHSVDAKAATNSVKFRNKKSVEGDGPFADRTAVPSALLPAKQKPEFVDDGTDDYLHEYMADSAVSKSTYSLLVDPNGNHADIQSIQEGAEITGKVVLLSRGGCGFLEKVKWAQRRGAVALIVGDDTKGGALIQMYAHGDTSNVTIPSIFTSRTTAHLLSTLIGAGSFMETVIDENGIPGVRVQQTPHTPKKKIPGPTFTPTGGALRPTMTSRPSKKKVSSASSGDGSAAITTQRPGWFKSLFFGTNPGKSKVDSSRPPSSGQLDWILVEDWKDDDKYGSKKVSATKSDKQEAKTNSQKKQGDDFVIGVQDWRDPDLVGSSGSRNDDAGKGKGAKGGRLATTKTKQNTPRPTKVGKKHTGGALQDIPEWTPVLRGGSITPGSGEYGAKVSQQDIKSQEEQKVSDSTGGKSLLTAIFGDDEEDIEILTPGSSHTANQEVLSEEEDDDDELEGLWVTLTPTSGASPFLDTLLVLVVSPLVTLTVVYALLLIRSRIRRRRWRAPKSVVERLPVRTYQTIPSPGSQSPRLPSPTSSSVTTPLLQASSASRPRPRSRTTTGIPEAGDISRVNSQPLRVPGQPSRAPEPEKNASVTSEWKKFMGKQVECVVCLEEYVDGVSRVMSLPCGHEFHVDCITPWLTTRRRTCPICKGDVVRSLARGTPSSLRYEPYQDDSDEDYQARAAETVNESSSSALPVPSALYDDSDGDLERGSTSSSPRSRVDRTSNWRSILASSLGSSRSPRPPPEDRDR